MPVAKQFTPTNVMALPTAKQSAAAARPEPASPDGEEPAATTQGDVELREFMRPKTRPRRSKSDYEAPSQYKVLVGERMRRVREAAGVTLTEAAHAMGYSQPVQLSNMENGQRPVTLRALLEYAGSFRTTTDHLLGLTPEAEVDPAVAIQQGVAAAIAEDLRAMLAQITATTIDLARRVRPATAAAVRLAQATLEANRALTAMRAASPEFDDGVRGGATLVVKLECASQLATDVLGAVRRLEGRAKGGMLGAAFVPALADEGRSVAELTAMLNQPRKQVMSAAIAGVAAFADEPDGSDHDGCY